MFDLSALNRAFWLFAFPIMGYADEAVKVVTPSSAGFGGMLAQMVLVLALVLGLLLVLAWVLRRAGLAQGAANGHLRVLGAISVGPKERVLLIQAGQEQLVIGVTAVEVTLLHLLAEPVDVSTPNVTDETRLMGGFAQKLQLALQRRQKVDS
jgi:flagellar protein FliO/FliZ